MTVIDVIDRPARVHRGDVREEHGTIRGAAVTQHVLVTVGAEAQLFEELFEVTDGRFGRSVIAVADVRFRA